MSANEMTIRQGPSNYSLMQVVLHWAIAALVIFQLVFGEEIGHAYRAYARGTEPSADSLSAANVHVWIGIAVLVLAIWRFGIRLMRGVPAAPADEGPVLQWIAKIAHFMLYLFIFGMPISGMAAWYLGVGAAAEVHELMKPVIIIVVVLHAAGALWQHFVVKSDVLMRMLKPGS